MRTCVLTGWMVLVAIALAACGGNVVVETDGGGGGSGGSSGSGLSDPQVACTKLCSLTDAFGCAPPSDTCVQDCVTAIEAIPADCRDEYADLLDCASVAIPQVGCDFTSECQSEVFGLGTCLGGEGP